jgi:hypothetical protein
MLCPLSAKLCGAKNCVIFVRLFLLNLDCGLWVSEHITGFHNLYFAALVTVTLIQANFT